MTHPALAEQDHRPWPIPRRRWSWRQRWLDLLFAHWPVPARVLQPLVPAELEVQSFDGTSWLGVVPFRMEDVLPRTGYALTSRTPLRRPLVTDFPELNLRIYVEHRGVPGVYFFSLDAGNPLAVCAARTFFHLPYFTARMRCRRVGEGIEYESVRRGSERARPGRDDAVDPPTVGLAGRYEPAGPVTPARPGSLEHWLTERYCLYTTHGGGRRRIGDPAATGGPPAGRLLRGEIHHVPWPLQPARAELESCSLWDPVLAPDDRPTGPPPLLHFARAIDVVVWNLRPAEEPVGR